MKRVTIHSDGGCEPNPGVGAWAAVLRHGDHVKEICGGEEETTNNRMELLGAIMALEALRMPCEVEFHTDSQYVRNGITSWIHSWKKTAWRKGKIKNVDLWQRLDAVASRHRVTWIWVRGHAGVEDNERCDRLCAAEIARLHRERARRGAG